MSVISKTLDGLSARACEALKKPHVRVFVEQQPRSPSNTGTDAKVINGLANETG
jgi:hypothetical protein